MSTEKRHLHGAVHRMISLVGVHVWTTAMENTELNVIHYIFQINNTTHMETMVEALRTSYIR